ncbi:LAMI_0B08262g1_1 [Lachancea mirantina]|uniref:LAMI_0B08262g1_1 n=1 Tax=Lachancea mirantina TaxID=1230905 RepID=A0A1G4IXV5_9SACH|nr:LAMI_0B08262g1_1 [Lachancea mirantina]
MTKQIDRDLFYKLASELQDQRVSATVSLVKELSEIDSQSREWDYVLGRLIKGLASNRSGARLGFSLCLTEVLFLALEKGSIASIDDYWQRLETNLLNGKVKTGKDERGLLFGKMFGLQALLNDPLFSKVFKTDSNNVDSKFLEKFMGILIDLSLKKPWLREPGMFTLYQAIEKLSADLNAEALTTIFQLLDSKNVTLTREGLAIYILLGQLCPRTCQVLNKQDIFGHLSLKNGWKNNRPFSRGNLPAVCDVLKDSTTTDDTSLKQQGIWTPRLHFVWESLFAFFAQESGYKPSESPMHKKRKKSTKSESINFPEFWKAAVDENFFSEKSSSERKYLGFLIFEKALSSLPPQCISFIFSNNLMRSLINQAGGQSRNLSKVAHGCLQSFQKLTKNQREKAPVVLEAVLFGPHGSIAFDKLTKTKTVSELMKNNSLTGDVLLSVAKTFSEQLSKPKQEKSHYMFCLDSLLHLVRSHKQQADLSWVQPILSSLVECSFFYDPYEADAHKDEGQSEAAKDSLSAIIQERLYSVLADLMSVKVTGIVTESWPLAVIAEIQERQMTEKTLLKMDQEISDCAAKALQVLEELVEARKADESDTRSEGFQLLFAMSIIQLYAGEEEALTVLEDLISFYEISKTRDGAESFLGLTEILLSFAAQKRALMRRTSLLAWESFIFGITKEDIKMLLEILTARENKEGFTTLFEGEDEDQESPDDEELSAAAENEDIEDDNDDDDNGSIESDEDADADVNVDLSESELDENDVEKIDKETASALAKALSLPDSIIDDKGEVKFEDYEESEDEEEGEDLDDEKMMELDDQLSEIFKRRKDALSKIPTGNKRKQEVKQSREDVISFKQRVAEMLELYTKKMEQRLKDEPSSSSEILDHSLLMMNPLLECLRTTLDRSLADKISKLLKSRICKISPQNFQNCANEARKKELISVIEALHGSLVSKKGGQFSQLFYSVASVVSIFLSKILVELFPEDETFLFLIQLYQTTTREWFFKGKFGAHIIVDFINWLAVKKSTMDKKNP